jgi:hypothetical protein
MERPDIEYSEFLKSKAQLEICHGFTPIFIPDFLFPFQKFLVEWAIKKGRSAIFADCGLGKTPMQLVWAENIIRKENKRVLILTPLAVSHQTIAEAEKFGIDCYRSINGELSNGINVTNYEKLHYFNPNDFIGCVCDESSILKNFDGKRKKQITEFIRRMPYRLLATATAAPNDYVELGTSSEALGELGFMDMLTKFFKSDQNTCSTKRFYATTGGLAPKWRFKGHAEEPFWRWVSSWARAMRYPSDLGFEDNDFILPPLVEQEYVVKANQLSDGMLFELPAIGLKEQREERRRTLRERCEKVLELVENTRKPALIWCHLNDEGDYLEKIIPDADQVSGKDSDDKKEERLLKFAHGQIRVLITKPKIGAWGLNFQHCSHVVFFPSHSFEQYYQGIRRCWRFGQKNQVIVDIVTTEGQKAVMKNLQYKAKAADRMFSCLVKFMNEAVFINRDMQFTKKEEVPVWLLSNKI